MEASILSTLLIAIVLAAAPAEGKSTDADQPRRFNEIQKDVRTAIRGAMSKDRAKRAAGVRQMTVLYREIMLDPRLETSPTLKQYKTQLWSRMTTVKNTLQREIAREKRIAEKQARKQPQDQVDLQAQQIDQTSQSLADQMVLISYSLGGPGQMLAESGGAFGGRPRDDGAALVELIQRTISPNSWDVNGGNCTIIYYAPLRVLVVRATSEVHGNVGGLADGLRRAGK